jgi:triacylglycerol esterase/lipase EstA (alpha/beta hydrolase family)
VLSADPIDTGSLGAELAGLTERIPLVLVHGIRSDHTLWGPFLQGFAGDPFLRRKFKPYDFEYTAFQSRILPGDPLTIRQLGADLGEAIAADAALRGRPLSVLAHSMGGLVARSFMEEWTDGSLRGGDRLLRLTTLATPHHGTPLADNADLTSILDVVREQGQDMAWDKFDGTDTAGHTNAWLRCLNDSSQTPFSGESCADPAERLRPRFFEKIFAFGAETGSTYSDPAYQIGDTLLTFHPPLGHFQDNDGVVPVASARFDGWPVAARALVPRCDHSLLPQGQCAVDGRSIFPGALGPLVLIAADRMTYQPGEPMALTISARRSLTADGDGVDVFFASLSDDGTMLWLGPAGLTPTATPVLRGLSVPDLDDGGPVSFTDVRPGRHAWVLYLVKPGSGVIDYSLAVYTIAAPASPPVGPDAPVPRGAGE